MAKNCCVCKKTIEKDDAPVLAMGGFGTPKCVCEDCESLIEAATRSREYDEISTACRGLGEALTDGDTGDTQIIEAVNSIIKDAMERGEAIKNGTYDFALDNAEDDEFDITEDLEETEEDRKKDEKDAKIANIIDIISSWAFGIILLGLVIFFIIKFVF